MAGASLVFVAAWFAPSPEYVPLLCRIVSSGETANWHEQSIELLGVLASVEAIPALTKAVDYRWDFDEWLSIPLKALRSLKAIGTSNALRVLSEAAHSDVTEIREEAASLLT
jgi:hypothetical protein